jgi:hypothetical protein
VRACACVCGGEACAGTWARVALLIQHAKRMRHIVLPFVASLASPNFSSLSHKRHDFREKVTENKMSVLIFPTAFIENISHLRRIQRCTVTNVRTSLCKVPVVLVGF